MQDNEFDDLFRSKLGGLEVQPSAQVWDHIAAGLGTTKKKSIIPMLSMAASILVVVAAGTWFMLDKPVKQVQNKVVQVKVTPLTNNNTSTENTVVEQSNTVIETAQPTSGAKVVAYTAIAKVKAKPTVKKQNTEEVSFTSIPTAAITETSGQQVLAAVPVQPVAHPVVPEMKLASSPIDNEAPVLKTINTAAPVAVTANQVEKKKRHGIHSLGDLINVVVSKVDKREDKLIEFTESDDDGSSVTGINLGIIKIKKEK